MNRSSNRIRALYIYLLVLSLSSAVGYVVYQSKKTSLINGAINQISTIAKYKASQVAYWRMERMIDAESAHGNKMAAHALEQYFAGKTPEHNLYDVKEWIGAVIRFSGYMQISVFRPDGELVFSVPDGGTGSAAGMGVHQKSQPAHVKPMEHMASKDEHGSGAAAPVKPMEHMASKDEHGAGAAAPVKPMEHMASKDEHGAGAAAHVKPMGNMASKDEHGAGAAAPVKPMEHMASKDEHAAKSAPAMDSMDHLSHGDLLSIAESREKMLKMTSMNRKVNFCNFHKNEDAANVYLSIYIPLELHENHTHTGQNSLIAIMVMQIDPEKTLFPLIASWPTASYSSETVLFSREADDIVYLNPLRHAGKNALPLRLSASSPDLDTSHTPDASGWVGEALDYRGVPVISSVLPVEGTNWNIAAKIDVDEVTEPLKPYAWIIMLLVFLFSGLSTMGIYVLRSRRREEELRKGYDAEVKLKEEEASFRIKIQQQLGFLSLMMENIPMPIYYKDISGEYKGCNTSFCDFFGTSKEEVVGAGEEHFQPTLELHEGTKDHDRAALAENKPRIFRTKINNAKGKQRQVIFSIAPYPGPHNKPGGVIGTIYDVTEYVSNEEALLKLSLAVENSPATVVITDSNGSIEYVNRKFTEITGYSPEEAIGRNPGILNAKVQPAEYFKELWETITAGKTWEGEFCNKTKSGRTFWEHALISPILNAEGTITHFVAVKDDITERRQISEELKRAVEAAEAANRAKSQFLANMSHEIRTPLNAIIGFSELTRSADLPPKLQTYANKIHEAGVLLLGIINDILDISKIEAGKLELEKTPFSLDKVIAGALSVTQQKAIDKNIRMHLSMDPGIPAELIGDPLRLGQVLTNLLNNAVKFTEKGEISLTVKLCEPGKTAAVLGFEVEDTGIGMTGEELEKLFKPFTQADGSTTRKFGGTGLGLSISKRIIEMMGGTINVRSVPGKGSVFSFTMTFMTADKPGKGLFPDKLNSLHVLVADGDPKNLVSTMNIMKRFSINAFQVGTGNDAISEIRRCDGVNPYDLVLIELSLPDMKGTEATRLIKTDANLKSKPLVIMTSSIDAKGEMTRSDEAAIDGFLLKPFTASTLFDTVAKTLPLEQQRESATKAEPEKKTFDFRGANILLAEDNPTNQLLAVELLKRTGAVVSIANNGREAFEKITSGDTAFDLVLMDVQMPVMDGYEATKKIRADGRFGEIPIIALTAHALEEERMKILSAGMNAHIPKPINAMNMFSVIGGYLKHKTGQRPVSERTSGGSDARLPEISGLDTVEAIKKMDGNKTLYLKLLGSFVKDQAGTVEAIVLDLENGDLLSAAGKAHTLKGLAGSIGADRVAMIAGRMEKALAGESGMDNAKAMLPELNVVLDAVTGAINQALAGIDEEPGVNQNGGKGTKELAIVLRRLYRLLLDSDGDADNYLRDNLPALSGLSKEGVTRLVTQINSYDYDAAVFALQELGREAGVDLPGEDCTEAIP